MPTFTKFGALALTIALSVSTTLAQTPVRRTATKTVARPHTTSATRVTPTPTRKPVATVATAPAVQAAPAQTAAPAPVVARQSEPQAQPIAQPTPSSARPRVSTAGSSHRNVYLNAGVGLATYYGGGFPIGVSVEVDARNNFSVGGSIDYYRYSYGYYSSGYNFIYAGARGSYHLGDALNVQSSNFDPYIGATLGFRYAGYGGSHGYGYYDGYSSSYNSGLYVGIHVGARVLFSPKVGAFAEVGYGVSALKLGLAAKF